MDVESSIILLGRTPCSVKSVVQKVGDSIFANEATLENELRNLNAPEFADAKDRLFLLVLKQIPSSMYEVKSFSDGEQQEVLEVPSKKDFETLIKTAAGLGLGDPSSVLMSRKGWEKCSVTPTDNLGFEATPVKCSTGISNNYLSHFWTAEDKFCFEIFPGRVTFSTHSQSYVRLIKDDIAEPQTPEKK